MSTGSKKPEGGTVTIQTVELENVYRIVVYDDGVGFDPNKSMADGRSHVGISNVKNRLDVMCHGSFSIESKVGKGTTVIMEIPKEGAL